MNIHIQKPTISCAWLAKSGRFIVVQFDGSFKKDGHPQAGAGFVMKHSDDQAPLDSSSWEVLAQGSLALKPVSSCYSELWAAAFADIAAEHVLFCAIWPFEKFQKVFDLHVLTSILIIIEQKHKFVA